MEKTEQKDAIVPMIFSEGGVLLPLSPIPAGDPSPIGTTPLESLVEVVTNAETGQARIVISFDLPKAEIHPNNFQKSDANFLQEWKDRKWAFWVLQNASQVRGLSQMDMTIHQAQDAFNNVDITCTFTLTNAGKINRDGGW
jgi:hypothetical protein